jgi:hypothetical protein
MSSRGALEVIVFSDSKYVGSLMFTSPQITVGRDPRAMVRLDDPWVSLKHALIHFNGSTTIFEDVGSRNGASMRGERLTKVVVRPTDEIEIGRFRLRFVVHALDDQPAPAKQEPTAVFAIPGQQQKSPPRPDLTPTGPVSGGAGVMSLFDDQPTTVGTEEAPARREIVSEDHTRPEMKQRFDSIPETPQIEPAYTPPPERVEATVRQAAPTAPSAPQKQAPAQQSKKEAAKPQKTAQTDTEPGHSLDEVEAALQALGGTPVAKQETTTKLDPLPAPGKREEPTRKVEPKPAPRSRRPDPSGQTPPPEKQEKQARAEKPSAGIAETRAPSSTASRAAEKPAPAQASAPFLGDDLPQYAPKLPPPERVHHDDDDDEDDDADFVPSFSLIEALKGRGVDSDTLDSVDVTVETVAYCGEEVLAIRHLAVKGKLGKFLTRNEARKLTVAIGQVPAVEVYDSGRLIPESESARAGDGKSTISLRPGLSAILHTSEKDRLFVHFVPKALPPPKPELKLRPDNIQIALAGGSVGTHILVFAVVALTTALHTETIDPNEGRFAKIQTKDLELEPPPPPPPEPEPEPEPPKPEAPQSPIPQPKVKTKPIPMPHMKGPKVASAAPGPPQPSAAANSILGALKQSSINNGPQATAVTNLDAVSAPRAGGGFKVSGAIGKLPGDTLRIGAAGSGTGRVDTKTAAELGAKNLGKLTGLGTPSGKVRGLVTAPPARTVEVQGQLDRGEIQKVVNAHLREVQGCYERKLIKDPTLSGKIIFEWVISLTGSVTVVKIKFSDLRNAEVTSCIQSSIRTWHFPEPRGGSVTVTYPFVFSTMGM